MVYMIQCTNMYIQGCFSDVPSTDGCIQIMKSAYIDEQCQCTLIYPSPFCYSFFISVGPAGWPVGWGWLLPGVTPIEIQAHEFNGHQP